jgi:hypothetical protein
VCPTQVESRIIGLLALVVQWFRILYLWRIIAALTAVAAVVVAVVVAVVMLKIKVVIR